MLINNSRLKTYETCPRKYYWSYVYKGGLVRRVYNPNFVFGQVMHHLLAHYYAERDWKGQIMSALLEAVPTFHAMPDMEKEFWTGQLEWAERMMKEYVKWAAKTDKFTVIDIEAEGNVLLS